MLVPELEPFLESGYLLAEKQHKAPQCRTMQGALIYRRLVSGCEIADHASLRRHNLLVGQLIAFQILACERYQADARVTTMRQEEIWQVRKNVTATCTAPSRDDYGNELNDRADDHAQLASAQLMPREASVRFATAASIEISFAPRKMLLVPL
jgi:hypothetical protein